MSLQDINKRWAHARKFVQKKMTANDVFLSINGQMMKDVDRLIAVAEAAKNRSAACMSSYRTGINCRECEVCRLNKALAELEKE